MTADPSGSSTLQDRTRRVDESRRGVGWRGPGWRVFDARPDHGKQVRDWLTGVVIRHGCQADPSDAALVVSELFANALMHGLAGGKVLVGYCLWPGGARVVVCNGCGVTTPRLRDPGELDERGRGLRVVDAVAAAWGSFRAGNTLAVWCDLGKPCNSAATGEDWTWLRAILAAVALVPRSGRRRG